MVWFNFTRFKQGWFTLSQVFKEWCELAFYIFGFVLLEQSCWASKHYLTSRNSHDLNEDGAGQWGPEGCHQVVMRKSGSLIVRTEI